MEAPSFKPTAHIGAAGISGNLHPVSTTITLVRPPVVLNLTDRRDLPLDNEDFINQQEPAAVVPLNVATAASEGILRAALLRPARNGRSGQQ